MPLGIDPKVDFAFKLMLALGVLEMISKNPEDLQFYEARLKFLRDEQARLQAAMQEGLEKGLEKGMERGLEEGLERGLEEGLKRGELQGRIRVLQELLGEPLSSNEELDARSLGELASLGSHLRARLQHLGQ